MTPEDNKSNIMVYPPVHNASNRPSISSQEERIPAWKRLGLKLKNVKDIKEVVSSANGGLPSKPKQPSPDAHSDLRVDESHAEPLAKRRRVESHPNTPSRTNGSLARTAGISSKDQAARLKKKVSFTAETKLEDGGKELITDWEQDDYAYYEQKAAENDAKEYHRDFVSAQEKTKESSISLKKWSTTLRKSKDALDYLNLYYTSRSSWKFSKNREVWILRHILSATDIPPSFNIALASYVHGLGSRQARSRLLNQCQEALEKEGPKESSRVEQDSDSDRMEDPKRQKAYHDDAVRRFKRSLEDRLEYEQRQTDEDDPEYQRWLSRRRRAELLLWAVTPSTSSTKRSSVSSHRVESESQLFTSATSVDIVSKSGVIPGGHLLKKKNRTVVIEASSSSEDESEKSDDEDYGSELANRKGVSKKGDDDAASAASSGDSDSTSEEESSTSTSGPRWSVPSCDDESGMDIPSTPGKRRQSAISVSSRSETSTVPNPSILDGTSSSASTESDKEQDESESRSSTTAIDTQSSTNGDSETTNSDEDDSESDGD